MKKIIFAITLILFSSILFAQSDEVLDRLYEEENARTLETALLVFQASNSLTDQATIEDASKLLGESKWGQKVLNDGEFITVGGFSQLLLEAFQMEHGIMYNILPVRRYALKEMLYNGYILGNPYPGNIMTSFNVIYAVSSMPVDEDINKNYVDLEEGAVEESSEDIKIEAVESVVETEVPVETSEEAKTEEAIEPAAETEESAEPVIEAEEAATEEETLEEPVIGQEDLVEGATTTEDTGE